MFVKSLEKQITVAIITSAIGGYVLVHVFVQ
jgi:hydrogenase maturation factor